MSLKVLILAVVLPAWLLSQTGATMRPTFAVTSVKPNHMDCCTSGGVGDGGSVNRHVTLKGLIGTAYRLQGFRIAGGPGWIDTERYDVDGKTDDPKADFDQLRLMLRSLLEDRFGLKAHRETRTTAVYALVVPDKNGLVDEAIRGSAVSGCSWTAHGRRARLFPTTARSGSAREALLATPWSSHFLLRISFGRDRAGRYRQDKPDRALRYSAALDTG